MKCVNIFLSKDIIDCFQQSSNRILKPSYENKAHHDPRSIKDLLLFGHYEMNENLSILNVSITTLLDQCNYSQSDDDYGRIRRFLNSSQKYLKYLGRFCFENSNIINSNYFNDDDQDSLEGYIDLNRSDLFLRLHCERNGTFRLRSLRFKAFRLLDDSKRIVIIQYDCDHLMQSQFLLKNRFLNISEEKSFLRFVLESLLQTSMSYECSMTNAISTSKESINHFQFFLPKKQIKTFIFRNTDQTFENVFKTIYDPIKNRNRIDVKFFRSKFLSSLFCLIEFLNHLTFQKSIFLKHCKFRLIQFELILRLSDHFASRSIISFYNLIFTIAFDIVLGVLLVWFIYRWQTPNILIECFRFHWIQIVEKINNLLNLLQSMPAGLKLNYPLNKALSQIMFYHIYLWQNYIVIMQNLFPFILNLLFVSGLFGASFLISLLTDLFMMITVHIYSFYGYTSIIYSFQIAGIISLWRLFRGKKFNPLRNRIDSYCYDNVHLFIGTIFFTVFIFLLPTVLLYYAVFLLFRTITLAFRESMFFFVEYLGTLPLYSVWLWFNNSPIVFNRIDLIVDQNSIKPSNVMKQFSHHHHHRNYHQSKDKINHIDYDVDDCDISIISLQLTSTTLKDLLEHRNDSILLQLKRIYDLEQKNSFKFFDFINDIIYGRVINQTLPYWFAFLLCGISFVFYCFV
ncbi:putative ATP-dependent DNA helicase HFM1 [Sarcoptes scabiei]|nr:putative ATP-dependent DNA helicase HFM1 [Sarcoptes scabiei]